MINQLQNFVTVNTTLFLTLGIISVISFLATLLIIPWLLVRLPADYFDSRRRHSVIADNLNPLIRLPLLLAKNCLGLLILVLGVVLLFVPGQGLLTMVVGIILLDFPGKFRFQRWLVQRKSILNAINWLRIRNNREPLSLNVRS